MVDPNYFEDRPIAMRRHRSHFPRNASENEMNENDRTTETLPNTARGSEEAGEYSQYARRLDGRNASGGFCSSL